MLRCDVAVSAGFVVSMLGNHGVRSSCGVTRCGVSTLLLERCVFGDRCNSLCMYSDCIGTCLNAECDEMLTTDRLFLLFTFSEVLHLLTMGDTTVSRII